MAVDAGESNVGIQVSEGGKLDMSGCTVTVAGEDENAYGVYVEAGTVVLKDNTYTLTKGTSGNAYVLGLGSGEIVLTGLEENAGAIGESTYDHVFSQNAGDTVDATLEAKLGSGKTMRFNGKFYTKNGENVVENSETD